MPEIEKPPCITIPYKISKSTHRRVDAITRWEDHSAKANVVLNFRPKEN